MEANFFKKGQKLSAKNFNELLRMVLQSLKITAASPLEISQYGNTTHIRFAGELLTVAVARLTEDLSSCSTASSTADVISFVTSSGDGECDTHDVTDEEVEVWELMGRKWYEDETIVIAYGQALEKWIVLGGGKARWITFSCTEDMGESTSDQVAADVEDFWEGFDPDPDSNGVTIYDPNSVWSDVIDTCVGTAAWNDISGHYEIVECQREAILYEGLLNGALASTDANATVDGVSKCGGDAGVAKSGITSASNRYGWDGDDNAECAIVRVGTAYHLLQLKCQS